MQPRKIIKPLLEWYARHKRDLPWRRDVTPYRVWLSEIMLQQTTVPHAAPYFEKFTSLYPTISDLAAAPTEDVMRHWAGLGYYSRARNLHACAKAVAANGGVFPEDLRVLAGIGEYTAGAIAAIAFGRKAVVVDGNVERVISRICGIETPLPLSKPEIKAKAAEIYLDDANTDPSALPQAFMDLGATICTPKSPKCALCPIKGVCKTQSDALPRKVKAKDRPKRVGWVYWIENSHGQQLLHRRPDKGLLGGMAGLPTSDWAQGTAMPDHLKGIADIEDAGLTVKHVFTHFELTLRLAKAHIKKLPDGYFWGEAAEAGLPSVFKKAQKLAIKQYFT